MARFDFILMSCEMFTVEIGKCSMNMNMKMKNEIHFHAEHFLKRKYKKTLKKTSVCNGTELEPKTIQFFFLTTSILYLLPQIFYGLPSDDEVEGCRELKNEGGRLCTLWGPRFFPNDGMEINRGRYYIFDNSIKFRRPAIHQFAFFTSPLTLPSAGRSRTGANKLPFVENKYLKIKTSPRTYCRKCQHHRQTNGKK